MRRTLLLWLPGAALSVPGCGPEELYPPCWTLTDKDLHILSRTGPSDVRPGVPMLRPLLDLQGEGVAIFSHGEQSADGSPCQPPVPAVLTVSLTATPGSLVCGDRDRPSVVTVRNPGCHVDLDGVRATACEWKWYGEFGFLLFTVGGQQLFLSVGVDPDSDVLDIGFGAIDDYESSGGQGFIGVWYFGSLPERCQAPDSRCCEPPLRPSPPRPDGGA